MSGAFVILAHSGQGPTHYDLMLARGDSLATWQLPSPVAEMVTGATVRAKKLPDHRTWYLTYEGPLSGGRGRVRRLDAGTCEHIHAGPDLWLVSLDGLTGRNLLELRRLTDDDWTARRLTPNPE